MYFKLEDSTTEKVPKILENLSKGVLSEDKSIDSLQKDLFMILVFVLMLENDFVPITKDLDMLKNCDLIEAKQLTSNKSDTGVYEISFVMAGFTDIPVKLILSPLSSLMLINIVINDLKTETYTACLPISRYVVSPKATKIPLIYHDLKNLTMNFKNCIVTPSKSVILSYCGFSSASLVGLPEEILFSILMYLPLSDIVNISKTCKRLNAVVDNDRLWCKILQRDFKDIQILEGINCKIMYHDKFKEQQKRVRKYYSWSMLENLLIAIYF